MQPKNVLPARPYVILTKGHDGVLRRQTIIASPGELIPIVIGKRPGGQG